MQHPLYISSLLTIFLLAPSLLAVDVILASAGLLLPNRITQECRDLPPGQCCRSVSPNSGSSRSTFIHLLPLDIAAVFQNPQGLQGALTGQRCSGVPIGSKAGHATTWIYDANSEPVNPHVDGASYIKLPTTYPPSQTESNRTAVEGLLALA